MMIEAYIGLGSNLENPAAQIKLARSAISRQESVIETGFSSLYRSLPMGPQDQPDYVNAVMRINTDLSAIELLRILQKIEKNQGRVRKGERWGARVLDLDLLLYADQQIELPDLIVPHLGLSDREFVIYPLQEIASKDLLIPGKGSLKQLVSQCPLNGLKKLDS
jgi:2-amino-4-hydroxy-6-hydroxymethyldihydropteridine diphosphokinase